VKAVESRAASFKFKLSALTPFTVGSGRVLGRFDYTLTVNPRSGAPLIRVIDTERFIDEANIPLEKKIEAIEKRQAGSLDRYSRCVLACAFRDAREGLELIEFSRDPLGRPVVPASSLKGLLRTAVGHSLLSSRRELVREGVEGAMEGRWRREGAAQKIERRIFGSSHREDSLRDLRVAEPAALSNEDLKAFEVGVYEISGGPPRRKTSVYIEAIAPSAGVSFEFPISIARASEGPLAGREALLGALRGFSEALIDLERRFYADLGARDLRAKLDETLRRAAGRVALPFGFGAGWRSKTLGALLGPGELNRLAPLLSPGRPYVRLRGQPVFPKTRRWVHEFGRPAEPLGWVAVE